VQPQEGRKQDGELAKISQPPKNREPGVQRYREGSYTSELAIVNVPARLVMARVLEREPPPPPFSSRDMARREGENTNMPRSGVIFAAFVSRVRCRQHPANSPDWTLRERYSTRRAFLSFWCWYQYEQRGV